MSTAALLALSAVACRQTSYWRDAEALWTRAISCTEQNAPGHYCLGHVYDAQGRRDEAIEQFRESLAAYSTSRFLTAETHSSLAHCLPAKEAIQHLKDATRVYPEGAGPRIRLAEALIQLGRPDEAVAEWVQLGRVLAGQGKVDAAIDSFVRAIKLQPQSASAHFHLGFALLGRGAAEEGAYHLRIAARIEPDESSVLRQTAWVLATNPKASVRDGALAVELARKAVEFCQGQDPHALDALAAAHAKARDFSAAIDAAEKASVAAMTQKNVALGDAIGRRLRLYRKHVPYREPAPLLPAVEVPSFPRRVGTSEH